eukprot:CAMPEP_0204562678 /NCGR_PEP_ID=MMETSP0661-20131031/33886_1 /ASSEMBLY_ACC=CAM_ASM_000606 /TAXON_ID=109239 /ORGANISM="Alexandrium margalefi, Strain AMGDE01CS-322" /LENGTH=119 /DNA_ID=CAMNT_0051570175 /DNA_START=298 /DNA_END=658 /DNA_ORIENTATION=+
MSRVSWLAKLSVRPLRGLAPSGAVDGDIDLRETRSSSTSEELTAREEGWISSAWQPIAAGGSGGKLAPRPDQIPSPVAERGGGPDVDAVPLGEDPEGPQGVVDVPGAAHSRGGHDTAST